MVSSVPTATWPNKRQLLLVELCGARLCSCAKGQARAQARGPKLFKLCGGVIPDPGSDPGCGID